MFDRRQRLVGVEGEHQHSLRAGFRDGADRLRVVAEKGAVEIFDALHEITGDIELREIVIGVEIADGAEGIVDRDRAGFRKIGNQRATLRRGQRVAERLEQGRAARIVAGAPAL